MKKQTTKYFVDTEFLEGTQKRRIGKIELPKMFDTKNTIDLISIGMVSEDNREYYAISKDFNLKEAWNRYDLKVQQVYGDARNIYPEGRKYKEYWIRENVLKPIFIELVDKELKNTNSPYYKALYTKGESSYMFSFNRLKQLINKYGKTNKQIADEVKNFVYGIKNIDAFPTKNEAIEKMNIQLYGYYSAYDHVALCWLFGKMIDLLKGFPMYTRDLKQMLDEYDEGATLSNIKNHPNYPKVTNSHNALSDAKWNKELYNFLNNI